MSCLLGVNHTITLARSGRNIVVAVGSMASTNR